MTTLRYEEETALLRAIIFKVRYELGAGWSEEIYHQALVQLLQEANVPVVSKPRRWLLHRGAEIHHHILTIARTYGLGYPESVYRKLIAMEMRHANLPCISDIHVTPQWHGRSLPTLVTNHLLVADKYLLHVRANLEFPTAYDFNATKSYLHNLGLRFALIVNLGAKKLQIYGIKADE